MERLIFSGDGHPKADWLTSQKRHTKAPDVCVASNPLHLELRFARSVDGHNQYDAA
jgi:hypothetical protein